MRLPKAVIILLLALLSCGKNEKTDQNKALKSQNETFKTAFELVGQLTPVLNTEYRDFWSFVKEGMDSIRFTIVSEKEITWNKKQVYGLLISGEAGFSGSYTEKALLIDSEGNTLLESEFRQIDPELKIAECGEQRFTIDSLTTVEMGEYELLAATYTGRFDPCHGQNDDQKTQLYFFNNKVLVDEIELYFKATDEKGYLIQRTTKWSVTESILTTQTTTIENSQAPVVSAEAKLSYDGTSFSQQR